MAQASIFIIEPEAAIAHFFARLWEEHGYTVACATSQDEARGLLAAHGPDACGVVLSYDFADHEPTPYALLDRLRAGTRAPIVICTRCPATLYAITRPAAMPPSSKNPVTCRGARRGGRTVQRAPPGAICLAWQPGACTAARRAGDEWQRRTAGTPGEAPDSATAALQAKLALAGFRPTHLGELRTRPDRDTLPILVRWLPRVWDGEIK
jgi:hypothetical protein